VVKGAVGWSIVVTVLIPGCARLAPDVPRLARSQSDASALVCLTLSKVGFPQTRGVSGDSRVVGIALDFHEPSLNTSSANMRCEVVPLGLRSAMIDRRSRSEVPSISYSARRSSESYDAEIVSCTSLFGERATARDHSCRRRLQIVAGGEEPGISAGNGGTADCDVLRAPQPC